MPGFDRSGPEGKGSQTGRRNGRCNPGPENGEKEKDVLHRKRLGKRLRKHSRESADSENGLGLRKGARRNRSREGSL